MDNVKLKLEIEEYLRKKVYLNINVNKIEEVKENLVTVSLNYYIPKIIYDDSLKKQYIKFIRLESVYNAKFKIDTCGIVPQFKKEFVYKQIQSHLFSHNRLIEGIILDTIYPYLVKIPLIKNQLSPIYTILLEIITNNSISSDELKRMKRQERISKYISFLEGLEIIKKDVEGNYIEGNIPISLKDKIQKLDLSDKYKDHMKEEVLAYTFGYALKEGKKYLLEELKLTAIKPFLRIAVFYYMLACQIKYLNRINRETFYEIYTAENPELNLIPSQLNNQLQDMVNAGIFERHEIFFVGKKDILNAIC